MNWKTWIKLYALFAMLLYTMMFFVIWYVAFFGGKEMVLITINENNEMIFELISWFFVIPTIIYGWILIAKDTFKEVDNMSIAGYARKLLKQAKDDHGIDGKFEEHREIGIGYLYMFKLWTDPAKPKYKRFIISDETFATTEPIVIENTFRDNFNGLLQEFLK